MTQPDALVLALFEFANILQCVLLLNALNGINLSLSIAGRKNKKIPASQLFEFTYSIQGDSIPCLKSSN